MTGQTGNDGKKNVEIIVPIKCLSNFWRTLEMPLINCEVNLILTWSERCVILSNDVANQNARFAITDKKLHVTVTNLLKHYYNTKLVQQLKSGFKRVTNWNKYLSKPELLAPNPNLNHLFEPRFQGINRFFVLAFENDIERTRTWRYYIPNVEIKNYIMINGENLFDQPIKDNKVTYENTKKLLYVKEMITQLVAC